MNIYKREYGSKAKFFVIYHHKQTEHTRQGWRLMTSAGFANYKDAAKYLETIHPNWEAKIVKVVEQ